MDYLRNSWGYIPDSINPMVFKSITEEETEEAEWEVVDEKSPKETGIKVSTELELTDDDEAIEPSDDAIEPSDECVSVEEAVTTIASMIDPPTNLGDQYIDSADSPKRLRIDSKLNQYIETKPARLHHCSECNKEFKCFKYIGTPGVTPIMCRCLHEARINKTKKNNRFYIEYFCDSDCYFKNLK